MRDPDRIPRMLGKLQVAWERQPDLRLGQLLVNCCQQMETNPFYVEDDIVEQALDMRLEALAEMTLDSK